MTEFTFTLSAAIESDFPFDEIPFGDLVTAMEEALELVYEMRDRKQFKETNRTIYDD